MTAAGGIATAIMKTDDKTIGFVQTTRAKPVEMDKNARGTI